MSCIFPHNPQTSTGEEEARRRAISYLIEHSSISIALSSEDHPQCTEIVRYLEGRPCTPRRLAALTLAIRCNCKAAYLHLRANTHSYDQAYAQQLRSIGSIGGRRVLMRDAYLEHGLVSLILSSKCEPELAADPAVQVEILTIDKLSWLESTTAVISAVNARLDYHRRAIADNVEGAAEAWHWVERYYSHWYRSLYYSFKTSVVETGLVRECLRSWPDEEISRALEGGKYFHLRLASTGLLAYLLNLPLTHDYDHQLLLGAMERICTSEDNISQYVGQVVERNRRDLSTLVEEMVTLRPEPESVVGGDDAHQDATQGTPERDSSKKWVLPAPVNNEDLNMEPVENYLAFDIMRYVDEGGRIFQFTRADYTHIVTNENNPGVNPHTNRPLPQPWVTEATSRVDTARDLKLPTPGIALDLIRSTGQPTGQPTVKFQDSSATSMGNPIQPAVMGFAQIPMTTMGTFISHIMNLSTNGGF